MICIWCWGILWETNLSWSDPFQTQLKGSQHDQCPQGNSATLQSKTGHCSWHRRLTWMVWINQIGRSEFKGSPYFGWTPSRKMLSNLLELEAIPISGQSPIAREGFESPLSAIGSQLGSCSPVEGFFNRYKKSGGFSGVPRLFPCFPDSDWSWSPLRILRHFDLQNLWLTHLPLSCFTSGDASADRRCQSLRINLGSLGQLWSWRKLKGEYWASYSSIWNPINHSKPPNQGVFKGKYGESSNVTNTRNWSSTGLGPWQLWP